MKIALGALVIFFTAACQGDVTESAEYRQGYDAGYYEAQQERHEDTLRAIERAQSAVSEALFAAEGLKGRDEDSGDEPAAQLSQDAKDVVLQMEAHNVDAESYLEEAEKSLNKQ